MIEDRRNFAKWFVKRRFSVVMNEYQWRVWRPYQQAPAYAIFDTASEAHDWIANHPR